jgi:hypothetical protein
MRRIFLLFILFIPALAQAQVPDKPQPAFRDTIKPRKDAMRMDTTEFWRDSVLRDKNQRVLKDGAVLRPPRPAKKIRKFKIQYSDRIQYNVLLDWPMTANAGIPSVLTLEKKLADWEDSILPVRWRGDTTRSEVTWSILYRFGKIFLIDAPIESLLLSAEADFFGSMGRSREFKLNDIGYSFTPPYPLAFWKPVGSLKYDRPVIENQASRMQLAQLSGAALDAGSIASDQISLRWMQRKSLNYHESLHLVRAQMAGLASVFSLPSNTESGNTAASNWLYYTNRQFGFYSDYKYKTSDLKRDYAIATFTNPTFYTALYSVFYKYMIQGQDSMATPAIKLGYGKYVLPWARLGFTPFGPEWIPSLTLTKHRQMIQLYSRIGTANFSESYGGGVKIFNIKRNTNFSLNAHVSVWKQRYFFQDWIAQSSLPISWGGAAIVSGNLLLTKNWIHPMSLAFQAGYKTRGYLEGEVWEASPVIRVGLSFALDRDYSQDDTVPEYFTQSKKKKLTKSEKRKLSKAKQKVKRK